MKYYSQIRKISELKKLWKIPERKFVIAIDFDGTLFTDKFPKVGVPIKGAIDALKRLRDLGGFIIIWSARNCPVNIYTSRLEEENCFDNMLNALEEYNVPYDYCDVGEFSKIKFDFCVENASIPSFKIDWDRVVAEVRDIVSNDNFTSGAVERWAEFLKDWGEAGVNYPDLRK